MSNPLGPLAAGCAVCYYLIFWVLCIAAGSFAVDRFVDFNEYSATGVSELSQVYAMGRDWDRASFTDLMVMDEDALFSGCPDGWEDAYNRVFYGIDMSCDCLGQYGRGLITENEFVLSTYCDVN